MSKTSAKFARLPTPSTPEPTGNGPRTAESLSRMGGNRKADSSSIAGRATTKLSFLYVLGLASPTHPLPAKSYQAWTRTYKWKKLYGQEFLFAGPLFIHQLSHMWIDFRGIQDEYMRQRAI